MDISTIKERKSVRTFDGEPLSAETLSQLEDFIQKDENPFGVPITYRMLDRRRDGVSSPVIVGADTYIAAKYRRQEDAELGFGYSFERLVLYATSLGLGTVWLAATIDRKAFERARGRPRRGDACSHPHRLCCREEICEGVAHAQEHEIG